MEITQQIIFSVGEGEYSMNVADVVGIESLTNVVPVPNAASYILGIINLRGDVLPIYSLRNKFGLEEIPEDEYTKIIVTKSKDVAIAFKVDSVKEIVEFEPETVLDFPDIARNDQTTYIEKVAQKDGRLILLINQNRLLAKEEREAISSFVSNASIHM